jgi:hypothetical protein
MADLSGIPTDGLLAELQRRVECADKKDTRTVFIGRSRSFLFATHLV